MLYFCDLCSICFSFFFFSLEVWWKPPYLLVSFLEYPDTYNSSWSDISDNLFNLVTYSFIIKLASIQIATCMSAHGCWIYAKHAKENDEANAFFKRDFGEDLHATLTGTNRNRKASKSHSFCEHDDKEQKFGFWGYLMQIAYQVSFSSFKLSLCIIRNQSTVFSCFDDFPIFLQIIFLCSFWRNLFASFSYALPIYKNIW